MSYSSPVSVAVEPAHSIFPLTSFQQNYIDLLYLSHARPKAYERKTVRIEAGDVRCPPDPGVQSDLRYLLRGAGLQRVKQVKQLFQQSCRDALYGQTPVYLYVESKPDAGPFEKLDHQARRGMVQCLEARVHRDQKIWPQLCVSP